MFIPELVVHIFFFTVGLFTVILTFSSAIATFVLPRARSAVSIASSLGC
jgi:hypothetical protein